MQGHYRDLRTNRLDTYYYGGYSEKKVMNFYLSNIADYAYRIVNESCGYVDKDFPSKIASLIKLLLCYKKNQYAIFLDNQNNNNVRVASLKQYLKIRTWIKMNSNENAVQLSKDEIIRNLSQLASLVRLVKEAIEYNPYAKFLRNMREDQINMLCKQIMESVGKGYTVKDADIQECYDSEISKASGIGSGKRFATSSCMFQNKVGKFYDFFNVKGKIIRDANGKFIGRYLEWKMDNGHIYVDRLYVNGENVWPALACIDEHYKDRTDVEFYPEKPSDKVSMKDGLDYNVFAQSMQYPYIDSFSYLCHIGDKVKLAYEISPDIDESRQLKHTHCYGEDLFPFQCKKCGVKFLTKAALRFHTMLETKFKSGKLFEQNKKLKEIVNNYLKEVQDNAE